jgi:hypothetical protein
MAADKQRSGRPSATRTGDNTARVREFVPSDRRLTFRIIADEVNMNREIVRFTLTEELAMRKICATMMPRNLTKSQRDARLSTVFDIQMHYGDAAASLLTWSHTLRLFLIVRTALKGYHFQSTDDIQTSVTQLLNDIPQNAFQEWYNQWWHRWKSVCRHKGCTLKVTTL